MSSRIYALLVGINDYPADVGRLRGCLNDVKHFHEYLCETFDEKLSSVAIATTSGSSFATPVGGASTWVAFMTDGRPLAFDAACSMGQLGSGNGAVYLTNGLRDYAVVLNPLGGVRIHAWNPGAAQWQI